MFFRCLWSGFCEMKALCVRLVIGGFGGVAKVFCVCGCRAYVGIWRVWSGGVLLLCGWGRKVYLVE